MKNTAFLLYFKECCSCEIAPYKNRAQFFLSQKWLSYTVFRWLICKVCSCVIVAEQKARAVYDNILRLSDDPDVNEVIKFLRQREIVHFQRFGEANRTERNSF